jgi:hypothetical protein
MDHKEGVQVVEITNPLKCKATISRVIQTFTQGLTRTIMVTNLIPHLRATQIFRINIKITGDRCSSLTFQDKAEEVELHPLKVTLL